MQIYLPIAEVSVNAFLLLGLGGIVGVLSGLFGVGGGFIITPLLFFIGIPPGVAVATGANQVVASSISGVLTQFKRKAVDVPMGLVLQGGGLLGSLIGIWIFNRLTALGQIDLVVQLCYVLLLGTIGSLMLIEALRALGRARRNAPPPMRRRPAEESWTRRLPFKMKFRASGLYISVIPPVLIGIGVGILGAIMGVGGGFVMVPAMIYLLGMPTKVVVGTSLFQVITVSAFTTFMHAITNHSVDIMLALLLIVGGVIGAQIGTILAGRLKAEQMRILLALLIVAVAAKLGLDLLLRPSDLFSLSVGDP